MWVAWSWFHGENRVPIRINLTQGEDDDSFTWFRTITLVADDHHRGRVGENVQKAGNLGKWR